MVSPRSKFHRHARAAVGVPGFFADGFDQRQHLHIRESLPLRTATTLPGRLATYADRQHVTHHGQWELLSLSLNPRVLHSASFAKYAVDFLISLLPS